MTAPSLTEIRQRLADDNDPRHVRLVQPELTGGVTTLEQIAALDDAPDADHLTISGLTQEGLEYLVRRGAQRWQAIDFWKCPRVADLSPLADLTRVSYLTFYWNQRATRLWDLRRNSVLRGLYLRDFRKLTDLADLAAAAQLHELEFGDVIHNTARCDSLAPLAGLTGLQLLSFSVKAIADGDITPLAGLTGLRELSFSPRLFKREQLAWLRARLGPGVQSEALQSHLPAWVVTPGRDTLLCGRGQRTLDSVRDAARIAAAARDFDALVAAFAADPARLP